MNQFYCPNKNLDAKTLELTDSKEVHHIIQVLRLKPGEKLTLFDGRGKTALGEIVSVGKQKVTVKIQSVQTRQKTFHITLACSIPKKGKFETIIEKSTELGVDEIIPLTTQRSEVHIPADRLNRKIERYTTVAVNAAKQSRRATVPVIHAVSEYEKAIPQLAKNSVLIVPSLLIEQRVGMFECFKKIGAPEKITIAIGPEGDFTPQEYVLAQKCGGHLVSLGNTVLKVETAALTALACAHVYFDSN